MFAGITKQVYPYGHKSKKRVKTNMYLLYIFKYLLKTRVYPIIFLPVIKKLIKILSHAGIWYLSVYLRPWVSIGYQRYLFPDD